MRIEKRLLALLVCLLYALSVSSLAQSLGSAGTVSGTVTDPAGAVIAGATVVIQNSVTGYKRTATTDATGTFRFANVPPNNYQLSVSANGFNPVSQSLAVRTTVPISVDIALAIGEVSNTVNVESSTASVENIRTTH